MLNLWEKSQIAIYFEDEEAEGHVRQGFNNLIGDATDEQIGQFIQSVDLLHELPADYAIVTNSHRYII